MKSSDRLLPVPRRSRSLGKAAVSATLPFLVVGGALAYLPGVALAQEPPAPVAPAPAAPQAPIGEGRLRFVVTSAVTNAPIAGVLITLKDPEGILPDIILPPTDALGVVITDVLSARPWRAAISATTYKLTTQTISVVADTTTDVPVSLETLEVIRESESGLVEIIDRSQTALVYRRGPLFLERFPAQGANPFSLSKALRSVPGFVEDSLNQVHPRGERAGVGVYFDDFLISGALQPHVGEFLLPQVLDRMDVLTAGIPAQFGGESGAILDLTPRTGRESSKPFGEIYLGAGGFRTNQSAITFGGQGGSAVEGVAANGRLGFLVSLTRRRTDNFLEPPTGEFQQTDNTGVSDVVFGRFDYALSPRDQLAFTLNLAPSRVTVSDRSILPQSFADRNLGQGYGYAGALSQVEAAPDANLRDQFNAGQDVYAREDNGFGIFQYRREISPDSQLRISVGHQYAEQDLLNRNPAADLLNLPANSSIEFDPTIRRDYDQSQIAGSMTFGRGAHRLRFGGLFIMQDGTELTTLIPRSQTALGNLLNLTNPVFAPFGPLDFPTLKTTRDGHYGAVYLQDTWRINDRLTLNYGPRIEFYKQDYTFQTQRATVDKRSVSRTEFAPRMNAAYLIGPLTVIRGSYNTLFTIPSLQQGAALPRAMGTGVAGGIGLGVDPQVVDQYDLSIERQLTRNQIARVSLYNKEFRRQLDTRGIVSGLQYPTFVAGPPGQGIEANGVDLSYNYNPNISARDPLTAYFGYTYETAQQGKIRFQGVLLPREYVDYDQRHTITGGVSYRLNSGGSNFAGSTIGLNFIYNSGMVSSLADPDFATTLRRGSRESRNELNLRLATRPDLLAGGIGLVLDVENLTNSRELINFRSPVTGTHFQQGRRVLVSLMGRF